MEGWGDDFFASLNIYLKKIYLNQFFRGKKKTQRNIFSPSQRPLNLQKATIPNYLISHIKLLIKFLFCKE